MTLPWREKLASVLLPLAVLAVAGGISWVEWDRQRQEIEGRQLEVSFTQALCTRESGFWAIARDGAGLYHDRAPHEIVAVAGLPPSAALKASRPAARVR